MNELTYYAIFAAFGTVILLTGGILLADYIMSSLGLMRLAKRRNTPNPWLAWIPVASAWLAGSVVDEYDLRQGKIRQWRTILVILTASALVSLTFYIGEFLALPIKANDIYFEEAVGSTARIVIWSIIAGIATTALRGCSTVCMYKVYESTVPEKAVKYFLISLLVPLGQPICLLLCSNKGYDCTGEDDEEIMVEVFEIPAEATEE